MNSCFIFFNDSATTDIYTLSLHDALPIFPHPLALAARPGRRLVRGLGARAVGRQLPGQRRSGAARHARSRSEEHTSELQSRQYLVCRLLLEKKTKIKSILRYK